MKEVDIFTDGACSGNPGPGGYGVILKFNDREKILSRGFKDTTNNRMELRAVIAGLSALKEKCKVRIYSDSKYIIDAINNGWAIRWKKNGWKRNKKDYALNPDLWEKLLELISQHEVELIWVKGHAGHDENERCDLLAVAASAQSNLSEDVEEKF